MYDPTLPFRDTAVEILNDGARLRFPHSGETIDARRCGVALTCARLDGEWMFVLTTRGQHISSPGSLVFPGGKCEVVADADGRPCLEDYRAAMRREFSEECLMPPWELNAVATLPVAFTPPDFTVTAMLCTMDCDLEEADRRIRHHYAGTGHHSEVERLTCIPVRHFFDPDTWDPQHIRPPIRSPHVDFQQFRLPAPFFDAAGRPLSLEACRDEPQHYIGGLFCDMIVQVCAAMGSYERFAAELDCYADLHPRDRRDGAAQMEDRLRFVDPDAVDFMLIDSRLPRAWTSPLEAARSLSRDGPLQNLRKTLLQPPVTTLSPPGT